MNPRLEVFIEFSDILPISFFEEHPKTCLLLRVAISTLVLQTQFTNLVSRDKKATDHNQSLKN